MTPRLLSCANGVRIMPRCPPMPPVLMAPASPKEEIGPHDALTVRVLFARHRCAGPGRRNVRRIRAAGAGRSSRGGRASAHRPGARRRRRQGRRARGRAQGARGMHVPIDCIAGTSMGALVGGGYASGIPAAELEKFVTTIDWKKVVGSQGRRELEPIEQKRAGRHLQQRFRIRGQARGLHDSRRPGEHQQRRRPAAQLRRERATGNRFRQAADSLSRRRHRHGDRQMVVLVKAIWPPRCARAWRFPALRSGAHGRHRSFRMAAWCATFRSTSRASCVPTRSSS